MTRWTITIDALIPAGTHIKWVLRAIEIALEKLGCEIIAPAEKREVSGG